MSAQAPCLQMRGWLAPDGMATIASFRQRGYKVRALEMAVAKLCDFAAENYGDLRTVTKELAEGWIASAGPSAPVSRVYEMAVAASRVAEHIVRTGREAYVLKYRPKKKTPVPPTLFSEDELIAFFRSVDGKPAAGQRDRVLYMPLVGPVILRLLYSSGLRSGEAVSLKRGSVDLSTGRVRILNGKENRDRVIYVSPSMLALLREFDERMERLEPNREYFFRPGPGLESLSVKQLGVFFKTCLRRAGLCGAHPKDPTPHSLRHLFASKSIAKAIAEGRDPSNWVKYLSVYLGHESVLETQYYLHVTSANMREIRSSVNGFLKGMGGVYEEE